ncbi:20439_t:CDS:2 [Cetraspora pellucida]|uniref:20439_t:CDS:1 n=1 Tax=Cetraspora pellucida TaxID=1433469 RepID=A0A9N9CQL7_9GLOM|nr:20439_t:CDS:2 [Cetraspora pellucida]
MTTNSTIESAKQPNNIDHDAIIIWKIDINNITHIEIDCLDVKDLIEHKIKELIFNNFVKDVTVLIIIEIEGNNDYS